jgi:hypothetical protein
MPVSNAMADEPMTEHRATMTTVRWLLIAVCGALIAFSDGLGGRIGFAALLILAIYIGRQASLRHSRSAHPAEPTIQPRNTDHDVPRREAK